VQVKCGSELHSVFLTAEDSLQLEAHDATSELALMALGAECPTGCIAVLRAWRLGQAQLLPDRLARRALMRWAAAGLRPEDAPDFTEAARQALDGKLRPTTGPDNPVDDGIRWTLALGHVPAPEEIRRLRAGGIRDGRAAERWRQRRGPLP
jgi:hypothetical protein